MQPSRQMLPASILASISGKNLPSCPCRYVQIIVDDIGNVSLAARMWGTHSPAVPGAPGLFRITVTALREGAAQGGAGQEGSSDLTIRKRKVASAVKQFLGL